MHPATQIETPLGGRAGDAGLPESVYVFGTVSTGVAGVYNVFNRQTQPFQNPGGGVGCPPRLWLVSSYGREIQRFVAVGGGALAPLGRDTVDQIAPPAGASLVERSQLGIFVTTTGVGGARTFDLDSGQSIELYGTSVVGGPLMPPGFVVVDGQVVAGVVGLVVDAIIGCSVIPIEESQGHGWAYRTIHTAPAANTRAIVAIPPGATEVTIYQTGAGAASVVWETWYGSPAGAQAVQAGVIPWIAGGRKSEPGEIVPSITHLRSDLDVLNNRFFTLVFRIQP